LQELAGSKPVYRFLLTDTWPARNRHAHAHRLQYPPEYRDARRTGQGL